jgi:hypothetical protein
MNQTFFRLWLCILLLTFSICATAATQISAENGKKQTAFIELAGDVSYQARVQIVESYVETTNWVALAAIGLKDKHCDCAIYFYIGKLHSDQGKLRAWVKYLENRKTVNRIELDTFVPTDKVTAWNISFDKLGNVRYSINSSRAKELQTRITDPVGIEMVSGAKATFDITHQRKSKL